jgi:hypothetical protein
MRRTTTTFVLALLVALPALGAELTAEQKKALDEAKYVYVQSERASGALSKPAEIWFMAVGDDVYVGTRPDSHRVKRIEAGRTKARVAIGSADGPAYDATASLSTDEAMEQKLLADFAKKYPEGWKKHAEGFTKGFETGERVLVKYTPR